MFLQVVQFAPGIFDFACKWVLLHCLPGRLQLLFVILKAHISTFTAEMKILKLFFLTVNHGLCIKLHLNTVIKYIFSCPTLSQDLTFKSYGYHGINFVGTTEISEMSSKGTFHKMLYTEAFRKFSRTCRRSKKDLKIFYMDL